MTVHNTDGTSNPSTQVMSGLTESRKGPRGKLPQQGQFPVNAGTQISQKGSWTGDRADVFGYLFAKPDGKTRPSLELPGSGNVNILGISLLSVPAATPYQPVGRGWPSANPAADCTPSTARSCSSCRVEAPT